MYYQSNPTPQDKANGYSQGCTELRVRPPALLGERDMYLEYDSYEQRTYHELQTRVMQSSFHWARYTRQGDEITVFSLLHPHYSFAVINALVAEKFERWFLWMHRYT